MSRSLANAVYPTKHDGNGDNRFAILVEGTGTGAPNTFEQDQYKYHIQEMGLLLTEHPKNIKPGPGYTGYYLQDHIYYVGDHNVFPYLDRDATITRDNILTAIQDVACACDSYDKVMLFYTSYGALSGGASYFDVNNYNAITITAGVPDDIDADMLDDYLDTIECKDMIIWLQPSYSGNWINPLKQESGPPVVPEKNRVILTSCKSGEDAVFDKCNKDLTGDSGEYYVQYLSSSPSTGYERYTTTSGLYDIIDYANNVQDSVYEVDSNDDDNIDFYENFNDLGAEFVSGLTEAFYIDRDYYYYDSFQQIQHHQSNNDLDADETANPEITVGNSNDYVSCKEAHYFMLNWHLSYQLSKSPWDEDPDIDYTWLEIGTTYIY